MRIPVAELLVTPMPPGYIYLLKFRQVYHGFKTETDFAFQSRVAVVEYLEQLWESWRQVLTEEEWERIPPVPSLEEITEGLNRGPIDHLGYLQYEIVGIGFQSQGEDHSVFLVLNMMPLYK